MCMVDISIVNQDCKPTYTPLGEVSPTSPVSPAQSPRDWSLSLGSLVPDPSRMASRKHGEKERDT